MSSSPLTLLGMGGLDRAPSYDPRLVKQLKAFNLTPRNLTDHLNRYRDEACVYPHPKLGCMDGGPLTINRVYPIHDVRFNDLGTEIQVTTIDNHDLRCTESVMLVGTRADITDELPTTNKLILVLSEVRELLEEKWSTEMVYTAKELMKSGKAYQDIVTFEVGDLVVYKDNMMVPGTMHRRGTGIVIEKMSRYDGNAKRCAKTHEIQDLIIGTYDDDGDFAVMPISSCRLNKVPLDQIGTFRNPFTLHTAVHVVTADSTASIES